MNRRLFAWALAFMVAFGVIKGVAAYKNPWALATLHKGCGVECEQ